MSLKSSFFVHTESGKYSKKQLLSPNDTCLRSSLEPTGQHNTTRGFPQPPRLLFSPSIHKTSGHLLSRGIREAPVSYWFKLGWNVGIVVLPRTVWIVVDVLLTGFCRELSTLPFLPYVPISLTRNPSPCTPCLPFSSSNHLQSPVTIYLQVFSVRLFVSELYHPC